MITLETTGWECTQEYYEDVMQMHGVDLHGVTEDQNFEVPCLIDNPHGLIYTLDTYDGTISISAELPQAA